MLHSKERGGAIPRRSLLCRQAQNAVCKTAHTTFMWYISAPWFLGAKAVTLAPRSLLRWKGGFGGGCNKKILPPFLAGAKLIF